MADLAIGDGTGLAAIGVGIALAEISEDARR